MTDNTNSETGAVTAALPGGAATAPAMRLSLEDHARISAEMAEGEASESTILKAHGLSEQEWSEATLQHMTALAADVQQFGAEARLAILYSDSFAEHQQRLKPLAPVTPEQWAELQFEIDREGAPEGALGRRQLSLADYMRLVRAYAKRIAEEPAVAMRIERRQAELESIDESVGSPTQAGR